jgi:DNA mismatch endonuclease (patch repair protein)
MDTVSKKQRSQIMRLVRSKDTKLEIRFRTALKKLGYKYRKNVSSYFGKPDIVLPRLKTVIFIDSCFWHGCSRHCRMPHSNRAYWKAKIGRNKQRDKKTSEWYKRNGWIVLRLWEHSLHKNLKDSIKKIASVIRNRQKGRKE